MPPASAVIDDYLVRRFRRFYQKASAIHLRTAGLQGLVEEVSAGLKTLPQQTREEIDDRILPRILLGPFRHLLTPLLRRLPKLSAFFFARLSPLALRYLVGECQRVDSTLLISHCQFRKIGGEKVCREVCKGPTERVFRQHLNTTVSLTPHVEPPSTCACTIRFG